MEGGSARVARLREEATRALDGALSTCTPEQFSEGFPGLHEDSAILRHVFLQGQASLRQNALAEFDALFSEAGVTESLGRLDTLLAHQPELPDGSRLPLTSRSEAKDMIGEATLSTRRQRKLALEQAIRQVEEENVALQEEYTALQPALQEASAEIAACKALVEKTASTCEQWRVANS